MPKSKRPSKAPNPKGIKPGQDLKAGIGMDQKLVHIKKGSPKAKLLTLKGKKKKTLPNHK